MMFFFLFFAVWHYPLQEIQVATPAARAALPIPIGVCSRFVCNGTSNGMAANVWDFERAQ